MTDREHIKIVLTDILIDADRDSLRELDLYLTRLRSQYPGKEPLLHQCLQDALTDLAERDSQL